MPLTRKKLFLLDELATAYIGAHSAYYESPPDYVKAHNEKAEAAIVANIAASLTDLNLPYYHATWAVFQALDESDKTSDFDLVERLELVARFRSQLADNGIAIDHSADNDPRPMAAAFSLERDNHFVALTNLLREEARQGAINETMGASRGLSVFKEKGRRVHKTPALRTPKTFLSQ